MKIISFKYLYLPLFPLVLGSCATTAVQYGKLSLKQPIEQKDDSSTIAHTFFLIGDAGNADEQRAKNVLKQFKTHLDSADKNSTALFLGDNIYPYGMPSKDDKSRKLAEEKLDGQLDLLSNFKGNHLFIAGNHDWYSNGIKGLKEQQDYLVKKTGNKNALLPKNSCGIDSKKISDDIGLIIIDSEWFLADWNKNPGINEDCDIKTREDFFEELESLLNKNQNKTTLIAIHHPLLDNGSHGGKYSIRKNLYPLENKFPLPLLGTALNLARSTGGITHQDLSNQNYLALSNRIQTLIADRSNVIVVSGHDHNLQYIEKGNIKQIISGAGSKAEPAAAINPNDFSSGNNGYAILKIATNGDATVEYYGSSDTSEKLLFRKKILANKTSPIKEFPTSFPKTTVSTIYDKEATEKSGIYRALWGENYRKIYGIPVEAKTLVLDTLFGGAKATRAGGGHQTNSLRLETPKGEYVIRGLKKSGVRFLQSVAFKNQYVVNDFNGGFADNFLLDFYTSSHPYTSLAVSKLSNTIGLRNTDPELVYVPKQNALGKYNETFGDELYYLEVRPSESEENPNKVLGTSDVLNLLAKDEKYKMDEKAYIRARLFDMLIGDWDRHYDQWKFEQRTEGDKIYFTPIAKDRDQAFVKYDGLANKIIMRVPALRHMQGFGPKIRNIKWFNMEPYPLDLAFTKNATLEDWKTQAEELKNELTKEEIAKAFEVLPKEVQDEEIDSIKKNLELRKHDLSSYAENYFSVLQKTVLLTATNKNDRFFVERKKDGKTNVKIYRIKKNGETLDFEKEYSSKTTKEIWLYGLGDDDVFKVTGDEKSPIKLRLLGGSNNDTYLIENPKNVKIYDYKSKKNSISGNAKTILTDDYDLNEYNYKRPKYNFFGSMPNAGYNPDDGVILGLSGSYTNRGFNTNPYSSKHTLTGNYFTGSGGYEIGYQLELPRITGNWYYQLEAGYTNSKFIRNYFGNGNETENRVAELDEDFYRIRAENFYFSPSANWKKNSLHFSTKLIYEGISIEKSADRRISIPGIVNEDVFNTNHFYGGDLALRFENLNRKVNPSIGMKLDLALSYRQNLEHSQYKVPKFEAGLGFLHYLTKDEKLVLATYANAKWILSNSYEFYQMNTLGGNTSLRGYRFDRFYGKNSFYHTTDLRLDLGKVRTSIIPLQFGLFGGFDYGRVWVPTEISSAWHTSYGGGLSISTLEQFALKLSYFKSPEAGRFTVGAGLSF